MHSSYLVAESRDCVGRESGDVVGSGATIQAEIGEILAGPGAAIPRSGRILFKTVGMAIEDLAAARLVWEKQGTRDQGTKAKRDDGPRNQGTKTSHKPRHD